MQTVLVILVVSGSLLLGAIWGVFGKLSKNVEGFIVALAGGALIVSAVLELIEPSTQQTALWAVGVLVGGLAFAGLDYLVKQRRGSQAGYGLLVAITLDGIPENLALGVGLIGAGPLQVAALAGSIFLSNLPEAAGGAREMTEGGRSPKNALVLWGITAVLLAVTSLLGNLFLAGAADPILALVRCFAGGAVAASLAIEVFPKAFRKDSYLAGPATVAGLILALYLNMLG